MYSKLGAAIAQNIEFTGLKEGSRVLYLSNNEISTYTTIPHISNIIKSSGVVYVVQQKLETHLTHISEVRENVSLFEVDARRPDIYRPFFNDQNIFDVIICDIHDAVDYEDQIRILLFNIAQNSNKEGFCVLFVKPTIVEAVVPPDVLKVCVQRRLDNFGFRLIKSSLLQPGFHGICVVFHWKKE